MTMLDFGPVYPKIIKATFSFPEFVQSILESHAQTVVFDQAYRKNFDQLFNFENFFQQSKN